MTPPPPLAELLPSGLVTEPTREALRARLEDEPGPPRHFTPEERATLVAVLKLLVPKSAGVPPEWVATQIDARLANGEGDGWRYDDLPPDAERYAQTLATFAEAPVTEEAITAYAKARPKSFEELLAESTEAVYSHPKAQEAIGYVGYADGHGWTRIGPDEEEPWRTERPLPSLPIAKELPTVAAMRTYPEGDEVDAVVIGTGAGGAPLLARLAAAGLRVVALEAGAWWNPAKDFATDEVAQSKLFWTDERLSAGANPVAFGKNNSGTGVGGSTLHYTAYTPRPHADDLKLRTEFGVGQDWPLEFAEIESYLTEVEHTLGVSGPSDYPWGSERTYPLAPLPINGAGRLMAQACAGRGIRTSPAANAALSAPYHREGVGWRQACTNRGFCQAGCSVGAKASADVTWVPLAVSKGAEIRPGARVLTIERDASGAVTGVVYVKDGVERRQRAKNVFLCAGAIETPRLLLMNELANGSGEVGKNFMAHVGVQVWGQVEAELHPWKGIPGALISEDTHRPKDADFAGGYLLQSLGVMPVTYAGQIARAHDTGAGFWGERLGAHMAGYNRVVGINVLGECLPSVRNRVELSSERDKHDLPKPRVTFTAGPNEVKMTAHAEALMRGLWSDIGATEVWSLRRYAHIIGTARMGDDPARSVVDRDGAAHDVPGLWISDNSTFPSSLSVNPALTIMALSLRTADRFLARRGQNGGGK